MSKLIGILGGTFDPVHNGHLGNAEELHQDYDINEIRFVPCCKPVHKQDATATTEQRLDMLSLAIGDVPYFILDKRELERDTPSYMVETLTTLKNDFPNEILCLVIGMDSFKELPSWHAWKKLFDYAHIIVVPRPNYAMPKQNDLGDWLNEKVVSQIIELKKQRYGKIFFAQTTLYDISSTAIRARVRNNESIANLCPDSVIEYIKKYKIYL